MSRLVGASPAAKGNINGGRVRVAAASASQPADLGTEPVTTRRRSPRTKRGQDQESEEVRTVPIPTHRRSPRKERGQGQESEVVSSSAPPLQLRDEPEAKKPKRGGGRKKLCTFFPEETFAEGVVEAWKGLGGVTIPYSVYKEEVLGSSVESEVPVFVNLELLFKRKRRKYLNEPWPLNSYRMEYVRHLFYFGKKKKVHLQDFMLSPPTGADDEDHRTVLVKDVIGAIEELKNRNYDREDSQSQELYFPAVEPGSSAPTPRLPEPEPDPTTRELEPATLRDIEEEEEDEEERLTIPIPPTAQAPRSITFVTESYRVPTGPSGRILRFAKKTTTVAVANTRMPSATTSNGNDPKPQWIDSARQPSPSTSQMNHAKPASKSPKKTTTTVSNTKMQIPSATTSKDPNPKPQWIDSARTPSPSTSQMNRTKQPSKSPANISDIDLLYPSDDENENNAEATSNTAQDQNQIQNRDSDGSDYSIDDSEQSQQGLQTRHSAKSRGASNVSVHSAMYKKFYSDQDDRYMLELIILNKWVRYAKGKGLWDFLEQKKILFDGLRPAQGMRERFVKRIMKKVEQRPCPFKFLTSEQIAYFKMEQGSAKRNQHSISNAFVEPPLKGIRYPKK